MPTSIGHALAGAATAWAADLFRARRVGTTVRLKPNTTTGPAVRLKPDTTTGPAVRLKPDTTAWSGLVLVCAGLAALPDVDVLFHTHRTATHSVGAVILVTILAAAVTGKVTHGDRARILRISLTCGAAYATHLLLDWLAMDRYPPYGIQALWPFSSSWYISNLDWFPQVERRAFFTWPIIRYNAWVVVQECVRLAPILVVVGVLRARRLRQYL